MASLTAFDARPADLQSDERFQLLVESVRDYAIFILSPSGHVSTWNLGAERIKGYSAGQIIGRHFSTFYPPEVVASGKCELELVIATREGRFEEEGWRIRRDGTRLWANVVITALRDPEGTLVGFAKVTRDLTQRKAAEAAEVTSAAQRATLAEKERTQQFQERFIAILGHDLRNPLASIDMGTGLLRQRINDAPMVKILERMASSSRRMSRMIEQILDFTRVRLEQGMELNVEQMDLRITIAAIVDELASAFSTRTLRLTCPSLLGTWDRDRLEQVFSNLIGNALIHGAENTPVTVEAHVSDRLVQVSVHNEGAPIPPALCSSLFDPFRRGEKEGRTSKTAGLGLGLYICHELVLAHGGNLECNSDAERGTTLRVTLPLVATSSRHSSEAT